MAADVGTDVSTFIEQPDGSFLMGLDPNFAVITGARVIAEAVARRLVTPRGMLSYDPDYGLDLRAYVNDDFSPTELAKIGTLVEAEAEKDERVLTATATLSLDNQTDRLTVRLLLKLAAGPTFLLTLSVGSVGSVVLRLE